jgi:hypothetical protein
MKKITYLIVLCLLSATLKAQQPVALKFKYLPKHTYNVEMKMGMDMEMSMGGDSATTAKLKAQGVKQPMVMKMDMNMLAKIITGALTPAKTFSFEMSYDDITSKMTMNGQETPMPKNPIAGQKMTGECDADGKLHVDKITAPGVNEPLKVAMTDMMNKMQGQIAFPEKPLAIGDTFTQEIPMSIPAAGMNMDFVVKTVYKLTGIKGEQAFFDTDLSMTFDFNTEKNGIAMVGKGSGAGSGKMIYAIAKNYPEVMDNDFDMTFNMDVKEMKMVMKAKMKSNVQNKISAN